MFQIFCILMLIASNAFAVGTCPEPTEPACVSSEKTFKDKDAYTSCTAELVEMSKKTKEYVDCMKSELQKTAEEVQKKADAASDKTNALIKKFNCKADPKAAC
jgi:hypothetical protein